MAQEVEAQPRLSNCPFCGHYAVLQEQPGLTFAYYVECVLCGARTDRYVVAQHASDAWNRRHKGKPFTLGG